MGGLSKALGFYHPPFSKTDGKEDLRRLYCDKCRKAYCLLCKRIWNQPKQDRRQRTGQIHHDIQIPPSVSHYGKSCVEFYGRSLDTDEDREFLRIAESLGGRQCPKCKVVVERTRGCNHITCRCKYEFCYVCGVAFTNEHYSCRDRNGISYQN